MLPYKIFLSSPSDVLPERDAVEHIVRTLNNERLERRSLELIRWEHGYYTADKTFQNGIPRASECELVISIFWKTTGQNLPEAFRRPDGTYPTGSEYEFEDAIQAALSREPRAPDVLVYRKTEKIFVEPEAENIAYQQKHRLETYFNRWFRNEQGHFTAGFHNFQGVDDFADLFSRHLKRWLAGREDEITWTKGSPYLGLEPFQAEHAAIFYGRRREVDRVRARLLSLSMAGCAFLLIMGASGAGKSSLVRAGLLPRLADAGGIDSRGVGIRRLVLTPNELRGAWAEQLASELFAPEVLGEELGAGDLNSVERLASYFRSVKGALVGAPIVRALQRLATAQATAEHRAIVAPVILVIVLDQLEEIFGWSLEEAEACLQVLDSLCRLDDAPVWVIGTMRSDFQHRIADLAGLLALSGQAEIKGPDEPSRVLQLTLPPQADLRDIIRCPAAAAGLEFEVRDGEDLRDLIEAEARPDALPALQLLLAELYRRKSGRQLTFSAYRALGGIAGVMALKGQEVLAAMPDGDAAFRSVARALVTQTHPGTPAASRWANRTSFGSDTPASRLVDRLLEARLLIADHGRVRLAHDTLLEGWGRLKALVSEDARLLEVRQRVENDCLRWVEGGRVRHLLLEGFNLDQARELAAKWDSINLSDNVLDVPEYIRLSDQQAKIGARRLMTSLITASVVFASIAVMAAIQWRGAEMQKQRAERNLAAAQNAADVVVADLSQALSERQGVPFELARTVLERAQSLQDQLLRYGETSLAGDVTRAKTLIAVARTYRSLGGMDESERYAQQAKAILDHLPAQASADPVIMATGGDAAQLLGDLAKAKGDFAAAEASYEQERATAAALLTKDPASPQHVRNLTMAMNRLADVQAERNEIGAAEATYLAQIPMRRSLLAAAPESAQLQRDLSISLMKVADMRIKADATAPVRELIEESVALREAALNADPTNTDFQRDVAVGYERLGDYYIHSATRSDPPDASQVATALSSYQSSVAIRERLAADPSAQFQRRIDLAFMNNKLGSVLFQLGRPAEALQPLQAAYRVLNTVAANAGAEKSIASLRARNSTKLRAVLTELNRPLVDEAGAPLDK